MWSCSPRRERRVIERDVRYEDSDHHKLPFANLHPRLYPRQDEKTGRDLVKYLPVEPTVV